MKISISAMFFLFGLVLLHSACTTDNEEDLFGAVEPIAGACDTLSQAISYASEVQPALANYGCYGCHSVQQAANIGAGIILEDHANFVSYLDRVRGSVNREPGYDPMPQNGDPVAPEDRQLLNCWIEQGALDN